MTSERYAWKEIPGLLARRCCAGGSCALPPGRRLLDLGAAGAISAERCATAAPTSRASSRTRRCRPTAARATTTGARPTPSRPEPGTTPFDVVVCADVLEHLPRPEELLARIRAWLAPGGHLFVSLPNVANVTVRAGLLLGRFPYAEKGILDRTHLRFYTRKSARRLLEEAGFRVRSRSPPPRCPTSSPSRPWAARPLSGPVRAFASGTAKLWPTLFGYQFVLEAAAMTASLVIPAYNESRRIEHCVREVASWVRGAAGRARLGGHPRRRRLDRRNGEESGGARVSRKARAPGGLLQSQPREGRRDPGGRPGQLRRPGADLRHRPVDASDGVDEARGRARVAPGRDRLARAAGRPRAEEAGAPPHPARQGGQRHHPPLRRAAGSSDTQCGFKLFRGDAARALFRDARIDRFAWDVEILHLARKRGLAIAEVPVLWFNSPESKVRVVRDALQTLWDVLLDPLDAPGRRGRSVDSPSLL